MNHHFFLGTLLIFLVGCHEKPVTSIEDKATDLAAVQKNLQQVKPAVTPTQTLPPKSATQQLVNNPTPLPQGYHIDTTYLKHPLFVDLNGDGKRDAFRVLKNPNQKGMKYLFEFRISDSDEVYYYKSEEEGEDLDIFGRFEVAPKTGIYIDEKYRFGENGDIIADEQIDPKHYLKFKGDGVQVNVIEETCGASVFFLDNNRIKRIYLC